MRDIRFVSDWSGSAVTQSVSASELKDYDGVAVILQEGSLKRPGAILGAARTAPR